MWDERDHPRDEDGKFARNSRAWSKINGLVKGKYERDMAKSPNVKLTRTEYALFVQEIASNLYSLKPKLLTKKGNEIVLVEKNNIHTAIVYNGDFVSPIIKTKVRVPDSKVESLYDVIEVLKREY